MGSEMNVRRSIDRCTLVKAQTRGVIVESHAHPHHRDGGARNERKLGDWRANGGNTRDDVHADPDTTWGAVQCMGVGIARTDVPEEMALTMQSHLTDGSG